MPAVEPATGKAGRVRWMICGLLFFATTVNYADRQILGILAPVLRKEIGWNESQYGLIVLAFSAAYAAGLLLVGRMIDVAGTRRGYALALGWWSIATALHGAISSVFGFGVVRFLLGLGEAGNFPAAIKTVAEWFPKRERALATGIFNTGSNVGAVLAPLMVPWLALRFGWRSAFIALGVAGMVWIAGWLLIYRPPEQHKWLSAAEREYIRSDPPEASEQIPWSKLFASRQAWGLAAARFVTDPVWWFYLYWGPSYLNARFGWQLSQLGFVLAGMYLVANTGSVFGGWLSSWLIRRGRAGIVSRKLAMLASALMVAPIVATPFAGSPWVVVALLALAMAGHSAWAANVFTIVSDIFPKQAVSSVIGISGFGGAVGGMLAAGAIGLILQTTGSYLAIFSLASVAYFVGIGLIHLISPEAQVTYGSK